MAKEKQKLGEIKKTTREFLDKLGVVADVDVSREEETFLVDITDSDLGILIGYHGETLSAFQLILRLTLYKKLGEWSQLVVDVSGWRRGREESLRRLAEGMAERVKFTGEQQALPPMSAFERRIIHLALSHHSEVTTESEGEGEERKVIVKPK